MAKKDLKILERKTKDDFVVDLKNHKTSGGRGGSKKTHKETFQEKVLKFMENANAEFKYIHGVFQRNSLK